MAMKEIDLDRINFMTTRPMRVTIDKYTLSVLGGNRAAIHDRSNWDICTMDITKCEWPILKINSVGCWFFHHIFFPCHVVQGKHATFVKNGSYNMFASLNEEHRRMEMEIADAFDVDIGGLVDNIGIHKRVGNNGNISYDWPFITRSKTGTFHCTAVLRVTVYTSADVTYGKYGMPPIDIPRSQYAVHISTIKWLGHNEFTMVSDIMLRGEARECKYEKCKFKWVFNPTYTDEKSPYLRDAPRHHPVTGTNLFTYSGQCDCCPPKGHYNTYYCCGGCHDKDCKQRNKMDIRSKRRYKHVRGANRIRFIIKGPHDKTVNGNVLNCVTVFDTCSLEETNVKTSEFKKLLQQGIIKWMQDIKEGEIQEFITRSNDKKAKEAKRMKEIITKRMTQHIKDEKKQDNEVKQLHTTIRRYTTRTTTRYNKKSGDKAMNSRDVLRKEIAIEKNKQKTRCKIQHTESGVKNTKQGTPRANAKKWRRRKTPEVTREFLHRITYKPETYEERVARTTRERKQHAAYIQQCAGNAKLKIKIVKKGTKFRYINTHDASMTPTRLRQMIIEEAMRNHETQNILVEVGAGTHANSRGGRGIMRKHLLYLHQRWNAPGSTRSNMGTLPEFTFKNRMTEAFGNRRRTFEVKLVQFDARYDESFLWVKLLT